MDRRSFIELISAVGVAASCDLPWSAFGENPGGYAPGRIQNEYSLLLPGESEKLLTPPQVSSFADGSVLVKGSEGEMHVAPGALVDGWMLMASIDINGVATAVFERHVTHRGAIAYVTQRGGTIALIPKGVGDLSQIKPRALGSSKPRLVRPWRVMPGPDVTADYILHSNEDPCYENVAALGEEYIGWTLVSSDGAGAFRSIFLDVDGASRQPRPNSQDNWAPDLEGRLFDPADFVEEGYGYKHGYSKRTLLGGFLPVADIGVWNPDTEVGYEAMVLLPSSEGAQPMGRIRILLPQTTGKRPDAFTGADGRQYVERFWQCSAADYYRHLAGVWNHWKYMYDEIMPVKIPDPWLLEAARAGITLSRCSYREQRPTYQIGEGGYTKIPERSHALFPVAHYEFIWAQQLWGLTDEARPYMQHYLDNYVLPDGNFLYNTQEQVEAPLNVGIFLMNAARDYFYTRDAEGFRRQLPALERMLQYVLLRYEYGKRRFATTDRRYGLIWGSPEADLGDPDNDYPDSHPLYYQNAACIWRGVIQHSRALQSLGTAASDPALTKLAERYAAIAEEMRGNIQRSIEATIAASTPEMRQAGITPFEPNDIRRKPTELSSYENHRFMMDWFLADWGVPALDEGHLKHRLLAGQQICGLNTDGESPRTSNFMSHGTLSARIRMDDYRPFLLTLYSLVCYAADSGNRYSPEDAYFPGGHPGEGSRYGWSAVVNSVLQPTLGLRWLLCYEENDQEICHLQKAAPAHWFRKGEEISVQRCPTRFGPITWKTIATSDRTWDISIETDGSFRGAIHLHLHPADRSALRRSTKGQVVKDRVILSANDLTGQSSLQFTVQA